jgi:hypothetical protein
MMLRIFFANGEQSYYKVNQFLLVDLFYIGPIISVARVGRTGAWDNDPVN